MGLVRLRRPVWISGSRRIVRACTVSGLTVTMVGAGTCSITASQAGSDNYNPATDVTQTFAIGKIDQTIDFTDPTDTTFAPAGTVGLTATASSGLDVLREQRCERLHGVWFDRHDGRCGDVFDHRFAVRQR